MLSGVDGRLKLAIHRNTTRPAYNEALKRRGLMTIWSDPEITWDAAPKAGAAVSRPTAMPPSHVALFMRMLFGNLKETERIKKWALRETRPDQQEFRRKVAERDGLKCAITCCAIPEVLDAAHLAPRAPGGSDDPANGIILRVDLHRLFDAGLLSMDRTGTISVSSDVTDPDYRGVDGLVATTGADLTNLETRATIFNSM